MPIRLCVQPLWVSQVRVGLPHSSNKEACFWWNQCGSSKFPSQSNPLLLLLWNANIKIFVIYWYSAKKMKPRQFKWPKSITWVTITNIKYFFNSKLAVGCIKISCHEPCCGPGIHALCGKIWTLKKAQCEAYSSDIFLF